MGPMKVKGFHWAREMDIQIKALATANFPRSSLPAILMAEGIIDSYKSSSDKHMCNHNVFF